LIIAILGLTSLVAVLFNRVGLRTLFYLPFFTAGIAQFILWKIMLRPQSGLINATLRSILAAIGLEHLEMPGWLTSMENLLSLSPETGFPTEGYFGLGARDAIMMMGIWAAVGGNNMLLYLAGLSNVPQDLYEAASIDGAGRWKQFRHVSWPQLAPTTFFIVIMSCIGGLQGGFEQVQVMTNGGDPGGTTVTLAYYIYRAAFEEFRMGFASAISWLMFIIIFGITLINWKFGNRQLN
jgi:multiple sugar transport system permease protein